VIKLWPAGEKKSVSLLKYSYYNIPYNIVETIAGVKKQKWRPVTGMAVRAPEVHPEAVSTPVTAEEVDSSHPLWN
jgi:hypothetical protein